MPLLLFLLIVFGLIFAELSIIVWLGSHLGVFVLIGLFVLSFLAGAMLLRTRGLYTLFQVRKDLAQGNIPTQSLLKSGIWIVAGILLIIPGFISDFIALWLLSPLGTHWVTTLLRNKVRLFPSGFFFQTHRTSQDETVFEAEFEKQVDEDKRIK